MTHKKYKNKVKQHSNGEKGDVKGIIKHRGKILKQRGWTKEEERVFDEDQRVERKRGGREE